MLEDGVDGEKVVRVSCWVGEVEEELTRQAWKGVGGTGEVVLALRGGEGW